MRNYRQSSFVSLIIGVVFGCSLILLLNQSIYKPYRINNSEPYYNEYANDQESHSNDTDITNRVTLDEAGNNLFKKVRVLCWVMTNPANHLTKALSVKETWGNRCNILLFISSELDSTLPTVQLAVREGHNQLWGKTREAFRYIWKHYRDQADWFLKADDDTYVIVENLRYFLSGFNSSTPLWFGHKYKAIVRKGYFSGGAGYVLSKEAVRRFVEEGYFNGLICRHDQEGAEDAEMGKCMVNLNVSAMDTRDSKGRGRFFPFVPEQHFFPAKITAGYWYWNNIYYPPKQGRDCCSDSTISFHYVNPQQMYLLDFFIYQLRPFGLADQRPATPEPPPDVELTATPWELPIQIENATTPVPLNIINPINHGNTLTQGNVTILSNNNANGREENKTNTSLTNTTLKRLLQATFGRSSLRIPFLKQRNTIVK